MDALAFVVPLLWRTTNIERLFTAVASTTPDAHLVFVVNADDDAVRAHFPGWRENPSPVGVNARGLPQRVSLMIVDWPGGSHGDYARKINHAYRHTTEPFIFTGADDLNPHPGWYTAAWAHMANPAIGVVGTVDLCNDRTTRGVHSTHSLVRRSYVEQRSGVIDKPNQVYCELYSHDYVDDELVATARKRGAYAHAFDSVVEHLHPNAGKAEMDSTYELPRSRVATNRRIFMRRRHLWS